MKWFNVKILNVYSNTVLPYIALLNQHYLIHEYITVRYKSVNQLELFFFFIFIFLMNFFMSSKFIVDMYAGIGMGIYNC